MVQSGGKRKKEHAAGARKNKGTGGRERKKEAARRKEKKVDGIGLLPEVTMSPPGKKNARPRALQTPDSVLKKN